MRPLRAASRSMTVPTGTADFQSRPRGSQSDPEQPIGPTDGGLPSGAPIESQLLPGLPNLALRLA